MGGGWVNKGGCEGRNRHLLWHSCSGRMSDASDADEFCDDEIYHQSPENVFDLAILNEEERRELDEVTCTCACRHPRTVSNSVTRWSTTCDTVTHETRHTDMLCI